MPGYIANYTLSSSATDVQRHSTLGCKLVTSFKANAQRQPPLPAISADIVLFDTATGRMSALIAGTQITTWRTVAASLVATRHLWFERHNQLTATHPMQPPTLAIVGCGVEGSAHAIGMASTFRLSAIRLWNRTASKADRLLNELRDMQRAGSFEAARNSDSARLAMQTCATVVDCVRDADIIVVATYAAEPLVYGDMLRLATAAEGGQRGVHINAVGAGPGNHHSELSDSVYAGAAIFVDSMVQARTELATLRHPIQGQVGDVMAGVVTMPAAGMVTVFQSMGEWRGRIFCVCACRVIFFG